MAIFVRSYSASQIPFESFDRKEILRYASSKESSDELDLLIESCIGEVWQKLSYKVCYTELDVSFDENFVYIGGIKSTSSLLRKRLDSCQSAVIFAATLGIGIDRQIARYNALSPAQALVCQAIGAERIEYLCDLFCKEIEEEKKMY